MSNNLITDCKAVITNPILAAQTIRDLQTENAALWEALVEAKDDMEKCMETGKLPAWSLDCVRAVLEAARKQVGDDAIMRQHLNEGGTPT